MLQLYIGSFFGLLPLLDTPETLLVCRLILGRAARLMRDSVTWSKAVSPPTPSSPEEFLVMAGRDRRRNDSVRAERCDFSAGISGEKGEPGRNSEASGLKENCLGELVELRRKSFSEYGGASVEVLDID